MIYTFDTSPLSVLFRNYYRGRFPTLWKRFEKLVQSKTILSTREVRRELQEFFEPSLTGQWIERFPNFFTTPTAAEADFVRQIFSNQHFRHIIEEKKLRAGGMNADPFVIAQAHATHGTVVTLEKATKTGAKIPDICRYFDIPCISLEGFMEAEDWKF